MLDDGGRRGKNINQEVALAQKNAEGRIDGGVG